MRGSLRQRRPGVWELRVSLGPDPLEQGKYRDKSQTVHGSKKDAEKALAQLLVDVNSGKHARSSATLADLLDRWLAFIDTRRSPTTMREYRRLVEQRIKPALGGKPFGKVTASELDDWYLHLEQDDGLAPASVRQIHAVIRGTYAQAVKWRLTDYNPAVHATPPAVRWQRKQAPSPAAWRALVAAAGEDAEMVAVLRLVGATGARRGEVCALRRGDVDLTAGVLTIARAVIDTKARGVEEKDTKTHGQRTVSLDSATRAAVADQLERMAKRAADGGVELAANPFVFSHALDCGTPLRPDYVTGTFRRICARAGLTGVRFHDLRHMHATYLLDAGVPVKTVSERLGHANASTTQDIYGHSVDGRDKAAADVMGGLLDG